MNTIPNPDPVLEVAVGVLGLIVIMVVHGVGIRFISGHFSNSWVRMHSGTPRWRADLLLAVVIGLMAMLHLAETLIWAAPIQAGGAIQGMRDSYYFVLESYTTLGEGSVALPKPWRLVGPIIAMSGLFTFGWTGSVLVNIMTEFGRFDRSRADELRRAHDQDPGAGA